MSNKCGESDQEIYVDGLSDYSHGDIECQSDEGGYDLYDDKNDDDEKISLSRLCQVVYSDSDTEMISDDEAEEEWTSTDNPPVLEEFVGCSGINTENVPETVSAAVNLFIGDDLFEYFVKESNRYYYQNIHNFKMSQKSSKWKDITSKEIKKFLGLIILMGQVRKDKRDDYWSTDPCIETPFFAKILQRDRFRQIWKAWHFNDNTIMGDEPDRLIKVRPILNYFLPKFIKVYKPKQQLSLDDALIPWKGRLSFKVYDPRRIIKCGILIRMLCEADSGYICNFEVYSAQDLKRIENIETIVFPYTDLYHHLYMDNYYNSVENVKHLLEKKIRVCGIIRKNRGLPYCLKNLNLKKGESTFRRKSDILIQIWKSEKEVILISTIHSADMKGSSNINRKTRQKIVKPNALIDYNKYKKDVDRADRYLSYFSILSKTTKWTKRVTMYFVNCALFNAFVVYNSIKSTKIKYKKFLHEVALHWITDQIPESTKSSEGPGPYKSNATKRTPKYDPPGRLSMDMRKHILEKIVGEGKKKNLQRRCRVCAAKNQRSETCYVCKYCQVPLHRGTCFTHYHTLKYY